MAIDGMKVIDLDSHLVGDLESWDQTIEDSYKEFLPRKLPTKENEWPAEGGKERVGHPRRSDIARARAQYGSRRH